MVSGDQRELEVWLKGGRTTVCCCRPRLLSVVSLDSAQGCRKGDSGRESSHGKRWGEGRRELWFLKTSSTSLLFFRSQSNAGFASAGVEGGLVAVMEVGMMRGEQIMGSPTCPRSGGPSIGDP